MKDAKRLMSIPGIGEVTATAVVATVNDAKHFDTSRSFAAWIGLVPRQYSTGGVARLIWALLHSEKEYQIDYVK